MVATARSTGCPDAQGDCTASPTLEHRKRRRYPVVHSDRGGLLLLHSNGIVIHPRATIGPNCLIFHQVTIGALGSGHAPRIGGHVDIGAGAKILGDISIGDHAKIGANAVVLTNVPQHATAVGVPARIIRTTELAREKVARRLP